MQLFSFRILSLIVVVVVVVVVLVVVIVVLVVVIVVVVVRPQRSIKTIASFDQWSKTIENH